VPEDAFEDALPIDTQMMEALESLPDFESLPDTEEFFSKTEPRVDDDDGSLSPILTSPFILDDNYDCGEQKFLVTEQCPTAIAEHFVDRHFFDKFIVFKCPQ
jgi:hypothetical protein